MGMEKINNKIIDKIADETYENRSLYEKVKQAEPETQRVSAFDNDVEDLIRAKEFLEKYRAQCDEKVVFKSAFEEPKNNITR